MRDLVAKQIIAERAERSALVMQAAAPFGERFADWRMQVHDGEKFDGGLGPVPVAWTDYWALRARSASFFKTNQYGRGIVRRMVTNIINTGLTLEADPLEALLPQLTEQQAEDWGIEVENKWEAWVTLPDACDYTRRMTFGKLQASAYLEALVSGDVLVIEHHNSATQLPSIELVDGATVTTPLGAMESLATGNRIEHGVEVTPSGEHVAYYVAQADLTHKRIPARGRNGRLIAWLLYATDKRHGEVRGEPLISLVMQGVSEVDRYRDSTQRKASVGSLFSVFFYQHPDAKGISTKPITAGAQRRVAGSGQMADGSDYKFDIASQNPGIVYEHLPQGVEPKGFGAEATDEKFGEFEEAMLNGISWALEIPPSIVRMVFGSSYSASRGEVKEFNLVMNMKRADFADQFTRPIYRSWLVAKVLLGQVQARGLLDAWRDPKGYEQFSAWTHSNWWGIVKEAVDLPKEVKGQEGMIANGWSTNANAARQMTGSRFESNIRKVARENAKIADSLRPELELRREFGDQAVEVVKAQAGLQLVAGSDIDG